MSTEASPEAAGSGRASSAATTTPAAVGASCPTPSVIPGVDPDDPLQRGIGLAMQAVWLFLDSDFEKIETLLHKKRHHLLYASEGYAGIQYMRGAMTFTREAMSYALQAVDCTVNLATHYRKPRGVGSMLARPAPRPASRSASPQTGPSGSSPSAENGGSDASDAGAGGDKTRRRGEGSSWLRMSSPFQLLRDKMQHQHQNQGSADESATDEQPEFDPELLDATYGDGDGDEAALDTPQQRSWASGVASMADSVIGVVRSGTQAIGISRPEWHGLKTMTPTQRHAELVHAEAYLLRAMISIGLGDGVLALLREGWHVRSAYATYRGCNAYIQDALANGGQVDDHFVSGTYLGMGVFNLVLSMLPAKLLRFVELVGFSADRRLGLELLAIAAGWRTDPLTADLLGPPPPSTAQIHPCGYGLRSEFCALVLLSYHVVLCNDLFLGYPNLPLAEVVLQRSLRQHPGSLMFIYYEGRLLTARTRLAEAIDRFAEVARRGSAAAAADSPSPDKGPPSTKELIAELAALKVDDAPPEDAAAAASAAPQEGSSSSSSSDNSDNAPSSNDWRQLQYLGHWERSLCYMSLGRWPEAASGFNVLRKENNWNKAVYTYAQACCLWEHYLELCGTVAPEDTASLSAEQAEVLQAVRSLMALVPTQRRRVAGKSIPVEKFVTRKAKKFHDQRGFLMRPGLELLHTWNMYSKMPYDRLQALLSEVARDIEWMAAFTPISRAQPNPYRHIYYHDDLAVLLLTKGCILRELAHPSFMSTLPAGSSPPTGWHRVMPELGPAAADTLLRVLRLMPMIWRDHYLSVLARFHLGGLYLAMHPGSDEWTARARWQWGCVLGGHPLSSPPFLAPDEYKAHAAAMRSLHGDGVSASEPPPAPECAVDELLLQATQHPSLAFYSSTWLPGDWRYLPPDWSDSRRYSLQNMIEVRTFNANNRLQEKLDAERKPANPEPRSSGPSSSS